MLEASLLAKKSGSPGVAVNTALLMHFDGANGTNVMSDDAGHSWTSTGATLSNTVTKYGTTALRLNTNQYITGVDSADYHLTSDFTIEQWVYPSQTGQNSFLLAKGSDATSSIQWYNGGLYVKSDSGGYLINGATGMTSALAWYHLALVKSGNVLSLYVNGYNRGSASGVTSFGNLDNKPMYIGAYMNTSNTVSMLPFVGYIDEFRISKIARYFGTGQAFTPPTGPFVLD